MQRKKDPYKTGLFLADNSFRVLRMRYVDHVQPDYCPQVCREKDQIVIIVVINFAFNHSNMAEPQEASKFGECLKHAMAK